MEKQSKLIFIRPFTNLHVGSEKNNSGKVDNLVQRDVLTTHPVIHSTSLKGAFRELLLNHLSPDNIDLIFGKGNEKKNGKESNPNSPNSARQCDFFNAHLLTYPVRSNKVAYLHATTPEIIRLFLDKIDLLEIHGKEEQINALKSLGKLIVKENEPIIFDDLLIGAKVEYHNIIAHLCDETQLKKDEQKSIINLLGSPLIIFNDKQFTEKLMKKLPVIARNVLDNGQSKNLWYEEVVPRESLFYTIVTSPKDMSFFYDAFKNIKQMQIGGNATVGYGYCKINIQKPELWKA